MFAHGHLVFLYSEIISMVSLAFSVLLGLGTIIIIKSYEIKMQLQFAIYPVFTCFYLSFFPGDSLRLKANRR